MPPSSPAPVGKRKSRSPTGFGIVEAQYICGTGVTFLLPGGSWGPSLTGLLGWKGPQAETWRGICPNQRALCRLQGRLTQPFALETHPRNPFLWDTPSLSNCKSSLLHLVLPLWKLDNNQSFLSFSLPSEAQPNLHYSSALVCVGSCTQYLLCTGWEPRL